MGLEAGHDLSVTSAYGPGERGRAAEVVDKSAHSNVAAGRHTAMSAGYAQKTKWRST